MHFFTSRKLAAIIQLILIAAAIFGVEEHLLAKDTGTSSNIIHFTQSIPIHEHDDPCKESETHQHLCHFGHCGCVFPRHTSNKLLPVASGEITSIQLNSLLHPTDYINQLFRPPITLT